ncbi:hypothetical protein [Actinoplanes derwentensis]|uniref:PknH-like extracellular domain-containing protein n=1 Tax=Actinoplanes derwentensis TaxID=113562 RepID=A0A1H1VZJ9_9ACTN|nr:hypothetical protein [Actinoplanes derwentensis]GID83984.1 hypothetical protein Ade03nite_29080 [Actinoplanes derwentensis]SDS89676.1 hypothetical protein SAMN04489716_1919 [Actinoplanes derwentensis]
MSNRIAAVLSIALTMPTIAFTAAPASAAVPPVEKLEQALLAPAQAPSGFVFHSRMVMASSVVPETVPEPCKTTAAPKFVDSLGGSVTVSFQKGGRDGTVITEAINAIGAKLAADQLKRHQAVLDSCPTVTKGVTYSRWQAPQVGVPTVGFLVTIEQPEEPTEKVITVVVSHGDVLATFTADAADSAALTSAVTAGVTRLKQTVG